MTDTTRPPDFVPPNLNQDLIINPPYPYPIPPSIPQRISLAAARKLFTEDTPFTEDSYPFGFSI